MRVSQFKKGGGFLDNVDVEIKDIIFTDEFNGEPFKAGKIKGSDGKMMEKPHSLNIFVTVRVDGADDDTTTTLKAAGNYDLFEISEDGHTATAADGGTCPISQNSAGGKFLASFFSEKTVNPLSEDAFDDDEASLNVEPLIGLRVRLVQQTDAERTKKYGQKVDKKTGKGYDRKDLIVSEVYEAEAKPAKASKSASKPAAGKSKKADDDDEPTVEQLAADTLKEILSDNDGSLPKSKLSMAVLKKLQKHPQREDVRKLLGSDKFLEQEDGWTYAKASKTQLVELEA